MMKKQRISIILVFIILILLGSFVYFKISKTSVNNILNTNEETGKQIEEIDVNNWITYKNEELGLEFDYNTNWLLNENLNNADEMLLYSGYYYIENKEPSNPSVARIVPKIFISVLFNNQDDNYVRLIEQFNNFSIGSLDSSLIKNIDIDGRNVEVYHISGFVGYPALIFEHKDFVYEIKYNLNDIEFDKFIDSFKFID